MQSTTFHCTTLHLTALSLTNTLYIRPDKYSTFYILTLLSVSICRVAHHHHHHHRAKHLSPTFRPASRRDHELNAARLRAVMPVAAVVLVLYTGSHQEKEFTERKGDEQ